MSNSPAHDLMAFVQQIGATNLPPSVIAKAKACLLDALGCGTFGSQQAWARIAADEMIAEGARGLATLLGRTEQVSAPAAALCNGTAIHGFELDDLIAESIVHPAATVTPAALAAAEATNASGTQLLAAIVAGYEVMHRVGVALGTGAAKRGFHTTSVVAPVSSAVAAGIAMQLTREELVSAVGLACSASSGIKAFAAGHGGGMVKRMHAGRSAEAGVRMAQLAARSFIGPPFAIDGKFGLLDVYGGAGANAERLTRKLGDEWAMDEVWFKVYPICGWIQSVVQLIVKLRGDAPLDARAVKAVRVGVSQYAKQNNGEPTPADTMGAQYSIPYCAAVALTANPRDPQMFQAGAIANDELRALARRVELFVDPAIEAVYPAKFGASVELVLAEGTKRSDSVLECHGTPADPCSDEEHLAKFRLLTRECLSGENASRVIECVRHVETLASVRELTALLSA
jgi:2-methylcitrate dehydratase PrpD